MHRSAGRLGIAALFLSLAFGQSAERLLPFTQINTPQGYQEIANAIRSVAEVQGSVDTLQKTFSISGAAENLSAAGWLFNQLDAPVAAGQAGVPQQYTMPGVNDSYLRVYRLVNVKTPTALQELVNAARSVVQINRMFPVASLNAIILRGTQEQVKAADFLIGQLDEPVGTSIPNPPPPYRYQPQVNEPADLMSVVRLKYAQTPMQIQEIVNAVRSIAELNRMFPYTPLQAVVMRDAEGKFAAAQWLLQQLDRPLLASGQPAADPAVSKYQIPQTGWPGRGQPGDQDAMRVFRLANAGTPQALQSVVNAVRTSTKCQRMFPNSSQRAIVMRGTESQAAEAERLILQLDVPPIPKP